MNCECPSCLLLSITIITAFYSHPVSPHVLQARTININSNQHLEFLGLTSLRTIAHPTILITGNPNLCFTESIQWDSFVPTRSNLAGSNALDADNQAPYAGAVKTSRVKREPYLALRERIQNEIERRLLQNLLSQLPGKSNRPRSYSIPTIFVHGNAHPEFCSKYRRRLRIAFYLHSGCIFVKLLGIIDGNL
ncbi:hypothetical protein FGIG_12692 [Fasciola gigantica]|uniref:Receptor L-domain domain-containing protein n=1 Tax=Fasciola gigantica TaxID=46835 RepID=A0A504YEX2_FASGI|nr:hypothetical protein FGIG_12692 [Fasciola gigantica]